MSQALDLEIQNPLKIRMRLAVYVITAGAVDPRHAGWFYLLCALVVVALWALAFLYTIPFVAQ